MKCYLNVYMKKSLDTDTDLKFHYGNVTYEDFEKEHKNSTNYWTRKIVALPIALLAGSVKVLYHLGKAILFDSPHLVLGNAKPLKVELFTLARDFQFIFGAIMIIFSECFGDFHLEESYLQSNLYSRLDLSEIKKEVLSKETLSKSEYLELPTKLILDRDIISHEYKFKSNELNEMLREFKIQN